MKKIIMIIMAVFMIGCAQKEISINKNSHIPQKVTVIPFVNLTQTPLAGTKVASIAEGVLRQKSIAIDSVITFDEKEYSQEDIKKLLKNFKKGYILTGFVNEYKYKAGIDAQPVVSVTLKIYDAKNKKYIYTATVSYSGSSYDSLGTLTQNAIKDLLNESIKK